MIDLIMPNIWHYRGKSDQGWIRQRMRVIPENMRREVADNYDNIIIRNEKKSGRKDANEYLDKVARKCKDVKTEVKRKSTVPRHAAREIIETKVDSNKKAAKSDCGLWSKKI